MKILSALCTFIILFSTIPASAANVDITDKNGVAYFTDLAPGEYVITTTKDGYAEKEKIITISESGHEVEKILDVIPGRGNEGGGFRPAPTPSPEPAPEITPTYITGYPNGSFKPDGNITRAESAAIFARILSEGKVGEIIGAADFTDVDLMGWYAQYIGYLQSYGVIIGYPDGSFKPDNAVTRAEFVVMAVRFGAEYNATIEVGSNNPFPDVQDDYWALPAINTASANGWLIGYPDGTFRGDNHITRAEVVTIINRILERSQGGYFE